MEINVESNVEVELSDFVLDSINKANAIVDDKNEQKECYEVNSPIEWMTKEEARGYLFELGNYYSQPESQDFYFKEIKKTYMDGIDRLLKESESYVSVDKLIKERGKMIFWNVLFSATLFGNGIIYSAINKDVVIPTITMMFGGLLAIDSVWKHRSNQRDRTYQKRAEGGLERINEMKDLVEGMTSQDFDNVMRGYEGEIKEKLGLNQIYSF